MPDSDIDEQSVWVFDFALDVALPLSVPYKKAEELMGVITSWAEENGFSVGGGFRELTPDERLLCGPNVPQRLLFPILPDEENS